MRENDFRVRTSILVQAACTGLLLLEGGLSLDFLLFSHPAPYETAAGVTIVALAAFYLLVSTSKLRMPTWLHFLWLTGSNTFLTFLPWIFGRAWMGIPGFLVGCIPLMAKESNRRDAQKDLDEDVHRAVVADRERIARDLHDLLGHSLSMITLKSEVVLRLVPHQDMSARHELTEIIATSRQALHDVRLMAHGMHRLSFADTVDSIRPTLCSLGIKLTVRIDCGPVPQDVDAVLAAVLREGVTNLLKHSKAANCRIEASGRPGYVRLAIANDGVLATANTSAPAGIGLGNLATRVGGLGGWFSSGIQPNSWFRLVADVPLYARQDLPDSAESEGPRLRTA